MFDLYFLTTNRVKFDHIKFLLSDYNINVLPALDYGRPYIEPRIKDRDLLLKLSVDDANLRLAKNQHNDNSDTIFNSEEKLDYIETAKIHQNKFFLIEDTSVIIDALSADEEFPGVDIKYWMRDTNFESINETLIKHGNNRAVNVRSDLVLYIPIKFRKTAEEYYKTFTGITSGKIVTQERKFSANPFYPWLDNKTFNKWFAPGTENRSISQLPIAKALKYDFRKKAVDSLIVFLSTLGVIENKNQFSESHPTQSNLFDSSNFIVCGPTCAGKSLLASYLARNLGMYHIEASDFMHFAYHQKYGYSSEISVHDFAKQALVDDPLIVSKQVITHITEGNINNFIVTGFRSAKELEPLKASYKGIVLLYVEANFELRFQRNISRAREDALLSKDKFRERDEKQFNMGLKDIEKISETIISNEKGMKTYFKTVKKKYFNTSLHRKFKIQLPLRMHESTYLNLDYSIMMALLINHKSDNGFLSTTEISKIINNNISSYRKKNGHPIKTSKNNVSRYFNQRLRPFFDVDVQNDIAKYRLSVTGVSRALRIYSSLAKR